MRLVSLGTPVRAAGMALHELVGALHSVSGLTPGEVLTALTSSTFGFQAGGGGGVLEKALDETWEGNGADDRVFVLDDDYQLILIFLEEDRTESLAHCAMAYAFEQAYGLFFQRNSSYVSHPSMASADFYWKGKLFGVGDENKIGGGTSGNHLRGINYTGWTYRLIGFKFSSMG